MFWSTSWRGFGVGATATKNIIAIYSAGEDSYIREEVGASKQGLRFCLSGLVAASLPLHQVGTDVGLHWFANQNCTTPSIAEIA